MIKRKPVRKTTKKPARPHIPEHLVLRRAKRIPREQNYWKKSNGDIILVREMSHLHLLNAARMILRSASSSRAEHDNMVRALIRFHGESSEFAKLIRHATQLSDFEFMVRFNQNFRKLWSELKVRRLCWVLLEEMKHPDTFGQRARALGSSSYNDIETDPWGG